MFGTLAVAKGTGRLWERDTGRELREGELQRGFVERGDGRNQFLIENEKSITVQMIV